MGHRTEEIIRVGGVDELVDASGRITKKVNLEVQGGYQVGDIIGTAEIVVLDRARVFRVEGLASKSKNTPFWGQDFTGRVVLTTARGRMIHDELTRPLAR